MDVKEMQERTADDSYDGDDSRKQGEGSANAAANASGDERTDDNIATREEVKQENEGLTEDDRLDLPSVVRKLITSALFYPVLTTEQAQQADGVHLLGDFNYYGAPSEDTRTYKAGLSSTLALMLYAKLKCPTSHTDDVTSDFFELTAADVRAAQSSLSAKTLTYKEAPLLTESLRNSKDQEIRNKWPTVRLPSVKLDVSPNLYLHKTVIRVKFADRSMLEKTFQSIDTIKAVYAFVRSCLREDVRVHKFVVCKYVPL